MLLTRSGTQAIDLVCRYLLHPSDTVLVDDPGHLYFQALIHAHWVELIGVPHTPSRPDVAAFEAALIAHQLRLYVINSVLHNSLISNMARPARSFGRPNTAAKVTVCERCAKFRPHA